MNIWAVHDANASRGGPVRHRLIVYARRDIPPDLPYLNVGSLPYSIRNQINDAAAHRAAQGVALSAAVLERSRCLAQPLERESESKTVSRLTRRIESSARSLATQRAAALVLADAYVRCAPLSSDDLVPLGAKWAIHCPQDGAAYDGNFLQEAEKLDPKGPAGELASLTALGMPCSLKGHRPWPDLAITKGQMLLSEFPPDQWTPWIHFAVAGAHAAKLSFAYPGGDPEREMAPLTPAAMDQERKAAIDHFERFIRTMPQAPEAIFAWQESWRLSAGLPPSQVHFGCGCE